MDCVAGKTDFEPLVQSDGKITVLYGRLSKAEQLPGQSLVFLPAIEIPSDLLGALYTSIESVGHILSPVSESRYGRSDRTQLFETRMTQAAV